MPRALGSDAAGLDIFADPNACITLSPAGNGYNHPRVQLGGTAR